MPKRELSVTSTAPRAAREYGVQPVFQRKEKVEDFNDASGVKGNELTST